MFYLKQGLHGASALSLKNIAACKQKDCHHWCNVLTSTVTVDIKTLDIKHSDNIKLRFNI